MKPLREVFLVIDAMAAAGVIENYAIGGAMAALFHAEVARTYDLDVFAVLGGQTDPLPSLSSVYSWCAGRGFMPNQEHLLIHGVPVQGE